MRSIKKIIKSHIEEYLLKYNIKDCKILVALSGGPDSTTLLSILSDLKQYNFVLIAAYYNHVLRSKHDLLKEEAIIKKICNKLNVFYKIGRAEEGSIKKLSAEKSIGLEEAARIERYIFLEKIRQEEKADFIATAHNINDNTETMIMRLFSNTGINGLSGIPEKRDHIIRPLSYVNRNAIEEYIKTEKILYSIDKTNDENVFLRNKIRNLLLPAIREVFPEVDRNLKDLSEAINIQNLFLDQITEKKLVWEKTTEGWKIDKNIFFSAEEEIRKRSLFIQLNKISDEKRINQKSIIAVAQNTKVESGKVLRMNSDSIIHVSGDYIFVDRLVNCNKKSYLLLLREGETLSVGNCELLLCKDEDVKNNWQNKILIDDKEPIIVRSYREVDKIKTSAGTKSIKKLFNEWSVRLRDRDNIMILENPYDIIAVIGSPFGYKNKIAKPQEKNKNKKILFLNYNNGDDE